MRGRYQNTLKIYTVLRLLRPVKLDACRSEIFRFLAILDILLALLEKRKKKSAN